MKNFVGTLWLICCVSFNLSAQTRLVGIDTQTKQYLTIETGETVVANYNGYLGREEQIEGQLWQIYDSCVVLKVSQGFWKTRTDSILIKDLVVVKRISPAKMILQSLGKVGVTVGVLYATDGIIRKTDLPRYQQLGLSLVLGIGAEWLSAKVFVNRAKRRASHPYTFSAF